MGRPRVRGRVALRLRPLRRAHTMVGRDAGAIAARDDCRRGCGSGAGVDVPGPSRQKHGLAQQRRHGDLLRRAAVCLRLRRLRDRTHPRQRCRIDDVGHPPILGNPERGACRRRAAAVEPLRRHGPILMGPGAALLSRTDPLCLDRHPRRCVARRCHVRRGSSRVCGRHWLRDAGRHAIAASSGPRRAAGAVCRLLFLPIQPSGLLLDRLHAVAAVVCTFAAPRRRAPN